MEQTLWVPGVLPCLTDIVEGSTRSPYTWSSMKKRHGRDVSLHALSQKIQPFGPAHFVVVLVEPNRKRDPDNVLGGALKIIFDALRFSKLMQNDGWKHVLSIAPTWELDRIRPGVRLTIREEP